MHYERKQLEVDLECYKIGCTFRPAHDTMDAYMIGKGGGSAYGGDAKPAKPEDERFWGTPGEIKTTYPYGYRIDTKIGQDGRAEAERHYTDHQKPWAHTDPHDHKINWITPRYGHQNFEKPYSNYWPSEFPNGAPEFKSGRGNNLNTLIYESGDHPFKTISDFKETILRGGEVVFLWKGAAYSVSFYANQYSISESYKQETEKRCDTPDEILEYLVGDDRLRDVITQVTVIERTI